MCYYQIKQKVLSMTKITKELKFKVVLEALKGDATRIELVNKYKISKSAINR